MYYDRRLPDPLLSLLQPEGCLGWLVPWLQTPAAERAHGHVQFRRDRSQRKHGGVQVYVGRTSPLEVRTTGRGRLKLHADPFYQAMTPALFAAEYDEAGLSERATELRAHLEHAATATHRSFLDREATVHGGLLRHHGHGASRDVRWVAVDSEARTGFHSRAQQEAFEASLPGVVGLPATEEVPRKLDLVGASLVGDVLLVEVKEDARGLVRAGWQAAVHVARFEALLAEHPGWVAEVLAPWVVQRRQVGLLGDAPLPVWPASPRLVPVIAAQDDRPGWADRWRLELAPVVAACRGRLVGLRLWRLGPDCRVLEEVAS
jgi:hypothetical protein